MPTNDWSNFYERQTFIQIKSDLNKNLLKTLWFEGKQTEGLIQFIFKPLGNEAFEELILLENNHLRTEFVMNL